MVVDVLDECIYFMIIMEHIGTSKVKKNRRFSPHLHINNILVTEQYGFRKGISTENAAFRPTECKDKGKAIPLQAWTGP